VSRGTFLERISSRLVDENAELSPTQRLRAISREPHLLNNVKNLCTSYLFSWMRAGSKMPF